MKQLIKSRLKKIAALTASHFGPHNTTPRRSKLWVLMYHRVLPKNDPRFQEEEPGMLITPDTLKMQLGIVREHFTPIHLSDWLHRKSQNLPLPLKACVVSFDDGWSDNYQFAFPILKELQMPATLFAVSGAIGTNNAFWPNSVSRLIKHSSIEVLNTIPWPKNIRILDTKEKQALAANIIGQLKSLPDTEIYDWLSGLAQKIPIEVEPKQPDLMTWQQLITMSNDDLIEIGSHTINHTRMTPNLSPQILQQELVGSKLQLEEQLGKPVSLFCYPNGYMTDAAKEIVAQHYSGAVTTRRGIVNGEYANPLELSRIGMHEDISADRLLFRARLSGWM